MPGTLTTRSSEKKMAAAGLLIGRAWKARETRGGWPVDQEGRGCGRIDGWMDQRDWVGSALKIRKVVGLLEWIGQDPKEGGDEVEKSVGGGARRIGWIGRARARVRLILYSR